MSRKSPRRGVLRFVYALQLCWAIQAQGQDSASDGAREFRSALAGKVQLLEKENAAAFAGMDGWLFLTAELRFLSVTRFWGAEAVQVSRSPRPEWADPITAIVDFSKQLKDRGIKLLLVPVPSKAEIYPDQILPEVRIFGSDLTPFIGLFYDELRSQGVDVLDLAPSFLAYRAKEHDAVFCKTDTHWSGIGCVLAAQAIAEKIRAKVPDKVPELPSRSGYTSDWLNVSIEGDLSALLSAKIPKPGPETVRVRRITSKATGSGIAPDSNSPVLLLGDSFTLVFHDFYDANAGLLDQLALELGFAPDLIGTRGSGATPVRISLFRRGSKDPDYLAKKKIIIWCFASREFTEAAQGWQRLPIAK